MSLLLEVYDDIWRDIKHNGLKLLLVFLVVCMAAVIWSAVNPPIKPKYWTIEYDGGVYTTDTLSYLPVGCVTIPRYVLCGDMVVVEHAGKLPNEQF